MESETTYSDVKVEVTIDAGEALSLERYGELLAHPDDPINRLGITNHNDLAEAYARDGLPAVVVDAEELMELVNGERDTIEWTTNRDGSIEEPLVTLTFEE